MHGVVVLTVPTIYVLSKNKKKYQIFSTENFQVLQLWACFLKETVDVTDQTTAVTL